MILFTSYKFSLTEEPLIEKILNRWKELNPEKEFRYFSDEDVNYFFNNDISDKKVKECYFSLRNGVAKADFFRICYINTHGGIWFDLDLEPIILKFSEEKDNILLFDAGFGNISYMFIGGNKNQKLFSDVIEKVCENIINNKDVKKKCVMEITGPRVIQNLIFDKMEIPKEYRKDGILKARENEILLFLEGIPGYEFSYQKIYFKTHKSELYSTIQRKNGLQHYSSYNFI